MRYLVSCVLRMDIPGSKLQELLPEEEEHSRALMAAGTLEHLFVVDGAPRAFLVFSVNDRKALERELSGYPLFEHATWDIYPLR